VAVDLTNVEKLSERQLATERQLSELAAAFKALEARVAEFARPAALAAAAPAVAAPAAASQGKGNVTPDILVVIAAAVTAFLGKKVRIRSAKMLQSPYELVNPWSQQGRVFVQASHNLR
jgi:methylmalonyl-CoA carboxyltransferase large subunit